MGLTPVRPEEVATVVTTLEMRERPRPRPMPTSPLRLVEWSLPTPAKYRALFLRVGARWLWYSRLLIDDGRLIELIHDPDVSIWAAVDRQSIEVGMLELDHRLPGECVITYFALIPELTGQGHGRWLMAHALMLAWRPGVECVTVQTCTLDHPSALGFYRAQGFVAVSRTLETFADPRVLGLLSADAAPQIPLLASLR